MRPAHNVGRLPKRARIHERARGLVTSSLFVSSDEGDNSVLVAWVTACLDLKRQAPLLGSLQLVHATGQISYLLIQGRYPSTRNDAFQRHQERAEPTHDCETAGGRSRSNKKHQRGEGKQAGDQYQSNVARQCCDQDWKQENGERGNAETLQELTQVFDMLNHYAAGHSILGWTTRGQCPVKDTTGGFLY